MWRASSWVAEQLTNNLLGRSQASTNKPQRCKCDVFMFRITKRAIFWWNGAYLPTYLNFFQYIFQLQQLANVCFLVKKPALILRGRLNKKANIWLELKKWFCRRICTVSTLLNWILNLKGKSLLKYYFLCFLTWFLLSECSLLKYDDIW